MVEARDIIARALCRDNASGICSEDCTGFDKPYCVAAVSHGEDADTAIAALTSAGWTLAPPGSRVVPEGGVDAWRIISNLDPENARDDSLLRDIHARLQRHGEKYPDRAVSVLHRNVVLYTIAAALRALAEAKP